MEKIKYQFRRCKGEKRAALVTYTVAGYPTVEESIDVLMTLESGGAGKFAPSAHSCTWLVILLMGSDYLRRLIYFNRHNRVGLSL
jgi:hypothetical protein